MALFSIARADFEAVSWQKMGTYLETACDGGCDVLINGSNHYLNFGSVSGTTGYGFRDNSGQMEVKDSGGAWTDITSGLGGGSGTTEWEIFTNTFSQSALRPTTTQNIHINGVGTSTAVGGLEVWRQISTPYFHATSSSGTSLFSGGLTVTGTLTANGTFTGTTGSFNGTSGTGVLQLMGDEVRIGNTGSPVLAAGDGDLFIEDDLEVAGSGIRFHGNTITNFIGPGLAFSSGAIQLDVPVTVARGGTGQTSFGQGWLHSNGTTFTSSTSPTVNYLTATSTTATSTFTGGLQVGTLRLVVDHSTNFVGIGTAQPTGRLTVASGGTTAFNILAGGGATEVFNVNNNGTVAITAAGIPANILSTINSDGRRTLLVQNNQRTNINGSASAPVLEALTHITHNYANAFDPLLNLADGDSYPLELQSLSTVTGSSTGIAFSVTSATGNVGAAIIHERRGGNSLGNLRFLTKQSTVNAVAPVEAMRIDEFGNIGIASTSPWRKLSVVGTMAVNGLTVSTAGDAVCQTANFDIVDAGGTTCSTSALRFKENVLTIEEDKGLELLNRLQPKTYQYKEGMGRDRKVHYGLIADEVAEVDPLLGEYNSDTGEIWNIDWNGIIALLVQSVQDLWKKDSEHDKRIAELEARIAAMEAGVTQTQCKY